MALPNLFLRRWRGFHWVLAVLASLYALFIALSYLYLPGKLQQVLQQDVAELIGRDIQVGEIAFNPFQLALTIQDFSIEDRPEQPLVGWQQLHVNLDFWGSLWGWQARLSDASLDSLRVNVERRKDGFNFTDILNRFDSDDSSPADDAEETAESRFALRIDDIRLRDGAFRFDDNSGKKPASSRVEQVDIGVRDLYFATGEDELNPFSLTARMPGGGELSLQGEYRVDPLLVRSTVGLKALDLPTFADFVENLVPIQLNQGKLDISARVEAEQQQEDVQVLLQDGTVQLHDLAVDDDNLDSPLLRNRQLAIQGIALNLLKRNVQIKSLVVDGLETAQWMKDDGLLRISPLLESSDEEVPTKPEDSTNSPWSLTLHEARIENSKIQFTDMANGLNAEQSLSDIQLTLKDISLVEGASIPLQFNSRINQQGDAHAEGTLILNPFSVTLDYQLKQVELLPFNPYVEANTWLTLKQGALDVQGSLALNADSAAPVVTLDLGLAEVQAADSRSGKKLLSWQRLDVQKMALDLASRQLTIEQVLLKKPDINAEKAEDGEMNLATLVKTSDATEAAPSATEEKPFNVRVGQVKIEDGITRFRDRSIKPAFRTALHNFTFELNGLTSSGNQPARFQLDSRIDKYAPFSAKGTLAPLQQQPGFVFSSQLRGLEMPSLSPYTGTYIGYDLRSGALSLDLDYQLQNRKLKGKNNILAKQLYLGDTVASEQAVNAPVALGLALLRDMKGNIDLNVDVSGDMDDPGFSVAGLVFKTLMNVIVKAAASPFQLLGSLVGGGEDLNHLTFTPGAARLDADAEGRLNQLVQALLQRPQLLLDVRGNAGKDADAAMLQQLQVRDQIAMQRKMGNRELALENLLDDKKNRNLLESMNDELKLSSYADRKRAIQAENPALDKDALEMQIYQQMLQDVAAQQTVGTAELLALADRRALAIKQYLVEVAGLDHARVKMSKTAKADLKGNVCELGLTAS